MKKVYRLISIALIFVMVASIMLFVQSCSSCGIKNETTPTASSNNKYITGTVGKYPSDHLPVVVYVEFPIIH